MVEETFEQHYELCHRCRNFQTCKKGEELAKKDELKKKCQA